MSKPLSERQLRYTEFIQRETGVRHQSTEEDQRVYALLKAGDLRAVEVMRESFGTLAASHTSDDPLRNTKYLFVAATTLAGRAAMSVGMDTERSNIASDLFIQRADRMTSILDIQALSLEMIRFYTMEVAVLDKQRVFSRSTGRALDYIYEHLGEPITAEAVSRHVGLSRSYFSTLFRQEVGIGIAGYITKKRIEAARGMLLYTDMSYAQISQSLAFSSQSHFIKVFKDHTGLTPRAYRNRSE